MRWSDMRPSENIEDRTAGGGGFGIGALPLSGGALVLIVIVSLLFGVNPLEILGLMSGSGPAVQQQAAPGYGPQTQSQDPRRDFVARVLGDTEDVWGGIFQANGK